MSDDHPPHALDGLPLLPGAPMQAVLHSHTAHPPRARTPPLAGPELEDSTSQAPRAERPPVSDPDGPFAECRFCKGRGCLVCPTERERARQRLAGAMSLWLTPITIGEPLPPDPATYEDLGTLLYKGGDQLQRLIVLCVPGPEMIMAAKESGDYTAMRAHVLAGKARYMDEGGAVLLGPPAPPSDAPDEQDTPPA